VRYPRPVVVGPTVGGTPTVPGMPFEVEVCSLIEVRDGKVPSIRMNTDWPALLSKVSA
jgi:ketosteroid isomerase-like protein